MKITSTPFILFITGLSLSLTNQSLYCMNMQIAPAHDSTNTNIKAITSQKLINEIKSLHKKQDLLYCKSLFELINNIKTQHAIMQDFQHLTTLYQQTLFIQRTMGQMSYNGNKESSYAATWFFAPDFHTPEAIALALAAYKLYSQNQASSIQMYNLALNCLQSNLSEIQTVGRFQTCVFLEANLNTIRDSYLEKTYSEKLLTTLNLSSLKNSNLCTSLSNLGKTIINNRLNYIAHLQSTAESQECDESWNTHDNNHLCQLADILKTYHQAIPSIKKIYKELNQHLTQMLTQLQKNNVHAYNKFKQDPDLSNSLTDLDELPSLFKTPKRVNNKFLQTIMSQIDLSNIKTIESILLSISNNKRVQKVPTTQQNTQSLSEESPQETFPSSTPEQPKLPTTTISVRNEHAIYGIFTNFTDNQHCPQAAIDFNYHPTVQDWLNNPQQTMRAQRYLDPVDPKFGYRSTAIAYHAFSQELDGLVQDYARVHINPTTNITSYTLAGWIELNGTETTGYFRYLVDSQGICFHRCFLPKTGKEIIRSIMENNSYSYDVEFPALT